MTRWLHVRARMPLLAVSVWIGAASASSDEYYPERTAWDRFGGGHLNISAFAFRDINRNGIYDMADHPMAGVVFDVVGGSRTISRRTNKSGFGNFPMSVLNREKDIVNRGEYGFLAVIPPGWLVTTDNTRQRAFFDLMPGAPADMISSDPLQPVGLAQELTITGRVPHATEAAPGWLPSRDTTSDIRVHAVPPDGERQEIAVDRAGSFSFAVTPGNWTVATENSAGAVLSERRVEVSAVPVVLAALVPGQVQPEAAQQGVVVTFDDLVTSGIKEIPFGYYDLNWHNWVVTHHKFYDGEGYANTVMSGEFVAYNSSGHPVRITRERPFDFIGGYFGSAWLQHAEGETLQVRGWRGDDLVYQERIKLSALGPAYFFANFGDVTKIEFETKHYWQFVGDDLEFYIPN